MAALGLISISTGGMSRVHPSVVSPSIAMPCSRRLCFSLRSIQPKLVNIQRKQNLPSQHTICRAAAVDTAEAEGDTLKIKGKLLLRPRSF